MKQSTNIDQLTAEIRQAVRQLKLQPETMRRGVVTRVSDGVAFVYGLMECGYNERLEIHCQDGNIASALVLELGLEEIGAVLLEGERAVAAGDSVTLTGEVLAVPIGVELIGRVVDPLGRPLDGKGALKNLKQMPVERPAPAVLDRRSVYEPLMTGVAAVDAMVPIGRGQRELIIGDRQTGKTALALDAMLNQKRQSTGVINIYVAIGQKLSKVAAIIDRLRREGVLEQSLVVVASASDPASLQYLAPYAATTMGEFFRDSGRHALIVYDDLSKHAVAYRQMSLLLRRPPGREAYPGDVFYLHSRLLERSAKLNDKLGGGSLTALPIIETQAGDISAYIPTNVISITDGQIFMETNLFYQGIRPAISVGLSVSRVGGNAQNPAIKSVAKSLRLELAQFRELAAFSQFSTDLDTETRRRIERGQRLTELLKQPQYQPKSTWEMYAALLAATSGCLDKVPLEKIKAAEASLLRELKHDHADLIKNIAVAGEPDSVTKKTIIELAGRVAGSYYKEPPEPRAKAAPKAGSGTADSDDSGRGSNG